MGRLKPVTDDKLHKFSVGQKVSLRKDRADVYKMAHAGAQGVISDRAVDELGDYPMVYIVWDKEGDWRYNGEHDMWTFEDHFEPVEENTNMVDKDRPVTFRDLEKLFGGLADQQEGTTATDKSEIQPQEIAVSHEPHEHEFNHISSPDEFLEILSKASESASESDAFLVIAIKAIQGNRPTERILVPDIYVQYASEAGAYALQVTTSSLSEAFHQEAIANLVQTKKKHES